MSNRDLDCIPCRREKDAMNLVEILHTWQSDGYPVDSQSIFVGRKRELPVLKFTIDYSRHVLEKSRDDF